MTTVSTKPPSGTRDFLPHDVRRREYVSGVVRRVYERYGYEPLETPAFENIETLLGRYGDEGNKLIFKILKRGEHERSGEADLALRYDLTVPLARVIAQHQNELPKYFKRYQIQPVWRADRPARGRFREFYQCDVDAIGSESPLVEVELLSAVSDVLIQLGFDDFVIRVNHRSALTALLECAGIPDRLHGDALVALDKLDKIGHSGVEKELVTRGIDPSATMKCLDFFSGISREDPRVQGPLDRLREFVRSHHVGPAAVNDLDEIVRLADSSSAHGRIRIDPSLARGLSYYTGTIMEIVVSDLAGSLGGGGRYDNLIGTFLGRRVPACGFSLGLERILVVMEERQMFPLDVARPPVDVMVTIWNEQTRSEAVALASDLRKRGLRVEIYPDTDRLSKQFKYASSIGVPMVAVVGDDERAAGTVAFKDLRSGEQHSISREEAPAFAQRTLEQT